jgi:hypothetical protein
MDIKLLIAKLFIIYFFDLLHACIKKNLSLTFASWRAFNLLLQKAFKFVFILSCFILNWTNLIDFFGDWNRSL